MASGDWLGKPWEVWVDTGGTFTDCIARDPSGELHRAKVLSTSALRGRIVRQLDATHIQVAQNWNACDDLIAGFEFRLLESRGDSSPAQRVAGFDARTSVIELTELQLVVGMGTGAGFEVRSPEPAPVLAARLVMRAPLGQPLPPMHMRLATTRGTNALLERRGWPTALFITHGFGDLLAIGDQQRPDIFALNIVKPPPLYSAVVEVRQRMSADGSVLLALDEDHLRAEGQRVLADGVPAAAIAFLHSYVNSIHEHEAAAVLRQLGFEHVICSCDLAPFIRILPRAQTAVVDAYLAGVIESYVQHVQHALGAHPKARNHAISQSRLHLMTSAGGLASAEKFRACDSLFSGPAGGVIGAAATGRRSGFHQIISFDMGGTSTDVARFDGQFEYRFEQHVGGVRLMAPALAIETVAAGGGSICDFADGRFTVGPRSAGAKPGPACYGIGDALTLTDVNLLLGRLSPEQFEIPIDIDAAEKAWGGVRAKMESHVRSKPHAAETRQESMLAGFLEIANERMAAAIEQISIRQGYDPKDYALVAFGGAGGLHACAVAARLGMDTIVMPDDASLLSAAGLGHAVIERFAQRQVLMSLADCESQILQWIDELSRAAIDAVEAEGVDRESIVIRRVIVNMRLLGQDATLQIEVDEGRTMDFRREFAARYRQMYGHLPPDETQRPIEIESLRVVASAASAPAHWDAATAPRTTFPASTPKRTEAFFGTEWVDAAMFNRKELKAGAHIVGPALVLDRRSTCVIEPDWECAVDHAGALVARRKAAGRHSRSIHRRPELIQLELFTNRLAAIADHMGQQLQRTALSTNVKERLDFSCGMLDAEGELVVNAPHIPVHLGAMGICVRSLRRCMEMTEGDVIVTNHPAFGGSHLPDITVVTPVFMPRSGELIGYVANRAHHAEIGGTWPGSMPPQAATLAEEGVVIRPQYLIHRGREQFAKIERLLRTAPFPSRAVEDNLADLRAAVAANHLGAEALRVLAEQFGLRSFTELMSRIKQRAGALTQAALARLVEVQYQAVERLDDGSAIQVRIGLGDGRAVIDFSGSAGVHPGNLNAPPAIIHSAVIYVLRLLIGERLPLNEGIMRSVDVRIPTGMLNPPFTDDPATSPAVVGGNTETSQRVVDTLLKALNLCACSQGTMNNVLFGTDRFGYYETVCGGSGAGADFGGADAVHTHMTNTRITDPEILEHRYPVRVDRFAVRRGSGGKGLHRGGDGAVRELTFLQPMSLAILSQHRTVPPYGMNGGEPGACGRQRIVRAGGSVFEIRSIDGTQVESGDRLILETPGGGAYGSAGNP